MCHSVSYLFPKTCILLHSGNRLQGDLRCVFPPPNKTWIGWKLETLFTVWQNVNGFDIKIIWTFQQNVNGIEMKIQLAFQKLMKSVFPSNKIWIGFKIRFLNQTKLMLLAGFTNPVFLINLIFVHFCVQIYQGLERLDQELPKFRQKVESRSKWSRLLMAEESRNPETNRAALKTSSRSIQ